MKWDALFGPSLASQISKPPSPIHSHPNLFLFSPITDEEGITPDSHLIGLIKATQPVLLEFINCNGLIQGEIGKKLLLEPCDTQQGEERVLKERKGKLC